MAIRFTGNQAIRTAPTGFLRGQATVSFALWVQVNTSVAPYGQYFFTQGGDTHSGQGYFYIDPGAGNQTNIMLWGNAAARGDFSSGTYYPSQVGEPFHLTIVVTGGIAQVFINNHNVGGFVAGDTFGPGSVPLAFPVSVGLDSLGFAGFSAFDATLDDVAIWAGYALSAADRADLLGRAKAPTDIAPADLAFHWPMGGTPGAAVTIGDAGIADSGPHGLSGAAIVGTGVPVYAPRLSYSYPASIKTAAICPSGKSLAVVIQDQAGNPANVKAINLPTIAASGGGGTISAYPTVGLPAVVPGVDEVYTLSITGTGGSVNLVRVGVPAAVDCSQPPPSVAAQIASALATLYQIDFYSYGGSPTAADFTVTYTTAGQVTTYTITYTGNMVCWKSWGDLSLDGTNLGSQKTILVTNQDAGFSTTGLGLDALQRRRQLQRGLHRRPRRRDGHLHLPGAHAGRHLHRLRVLGAVQQPQHQRPGLLPRRRVRHAVHHAGDRPDRGVPRQWPQARQYPHLLHHPGDDHPHGHDGPHRGGRHAPDPRRLHHHRQRLRAPGDRARPVVIDQDASRGVPDLRRAGRPGHRRGHLLHQRQFHLGPHAGRPGRARVGRRDDGVDRADGPEQLCVRRPGHRRRVGLRAGHAHRQRHPLPAARPDLRRGRADGAGPRARAPLLAVPLLPAPVRRRADGRGHAHPQGGRCHGRRPGRLPLRRARRRLPGPEHRGLAPARLRGRAQDDVRRL